VDAEKSLQTLIEKNLDSFLGVRFLASEYPTGKNHGGRIDTLGLDDDNCPVIIEYKKTRDQNVINQGLYYLAWLMDHQAEFQMLVMKRLRMDPDQVEWSSPRLLCIAGDFTKFDQHAVRENTRSIELLKYRRYGDGLLLFELISANRIEDRPPATAQPTEALKVKGAYRGFLDLLPRCSAELRELWESLRAFLLSLGDDVQEKQVKNYVAFRRLKNFACVEVHPLNGEVMVHVKADLAKVKFEEGFTRDMSKTGHFGTGNVEVRMRNAADLERAKLLIYESYDAN